MSRLLLFFMFLLSGFCGLLYQVIWLRLAFAEFGVITPVISVVLSVFMGGLAIGAWAAGRWVDKLSLRLRTSPLVLYGISEGLIGLGAILVPHLLKFGSSRLIWAGEMGSAPYLLNSALLITICILPWCILMGATFPLTIAFIKRRNIEDTTSFSFLYLANVIGAMSGAALSALVLVERLGFERSLYVGAFFNESVAALSFILAHVTRAPPAISPATLSEPESPRGQSRTHVFGLLFMTGFCSMAMEVVWTRAFTPITQTTIYAFAFLLTTYLLATWLGSCAYRIHLKFGAGSRLPDPVGLAGFLGILALFPLILNNPLFSPTFYHVFFSLLPVCGLLGYLTPLLVDRYAMGSAARVGSAFGMNALGCIFGPLFAGYLLLPRLGVKGSLLTLAIALFIFSLVLMKSEQKKRLPYWLIGLFLATFFVGTLTQTYEYRDPRGHDEIRRDATATVISTGDGMAKRLLVNGVAITNLTPITKIMAHFPLSLLNHKPESALVICFGMGTTFRSLVSWGIDVTGIELVPSVKEAFAYYFTDAPRVMAQPNVRVLIDDGRRFLRRTSEHYDLITLDPPPPVEAAGSSLLYSRQFYDLVKAHLKPGGVLQQWFPGGEDRIFHSVTRSIVDAFPHVRVYRSIEGWGFHFIASEDPIPEFSTAGLIDRMIERMPAPAQADLMEWYRGVDIRRIYEVMLNREIPVHAAIGNDDVPMLTDDKPFNEYFALRRWMD